jgi:heme exporter protein D
MSWGSFSEFAHMGGYGFYVWGSYGVTLALLVAEAVSLVLRERTTRSRLQRELSRGDLQ